MKLTPDRRDAILEGFGILVKELLEVQEALLDDEAGSMEWISTLKMQIVNSAFNVAEQARKTLFLEALAIRGGDMVLDDLRASLQKDRRP